MVDRQEYEKVIMQNCKLVEQSQDLIKENEELKQRIDKAIEYINENWGHWCSNHCKYATETINILQGSDKE